MFELLFFFLFCLEKIHHDDHRQDQKNSLKLKKKRDIKKNIFMQSEYIHIYNNLINLTRNKKLFFYFTSKDTFSDRLIIFMLHLGFFLKNYKLKIKKDYLQDFYDYTFRQIELNIREIGYGDQTVNKKMKTYVNLLYSVLNKIDKWEELDTQKKIDIFNNFLEIGDNSKIFVEYFDNYLKYISKLSLNSFTKSVIDHKF